MVADTNQQPGLIDIVNVNADASPTINIVFGAGSVVSAGTGDVVIDVESDNIARATGGGLSGIPSPDRRRPGARHGGRDDQRLARRDDPAPGQPDPPAPHGERGLCDRRGPERRPGGRDRREHRRRGHAHDLHLRRPLQQHQRDRRLRDPDRSRRARPRPSRTGSRAGPPSPSASRSPTRRSPPPSAPTSARAPRSRRAAAINVETFQNEDVNGKPTGGGATATAEASAGSLIGTGIGAHATADNSPTVSAYVDQGRDPQRRPAVADHGPGPGEQRRHGQVAGDRRRGPPRGGRVASPTRRPRVAEGLRRRRRSPAAAR